MSIFWLVITHYCVISIFTFVCFLVGNLLIKKVDFQSRLEGIVYAIAIGVGVIAYLVMFIGLLKGLYPWIMATILLILVGIAIFPSLEAIIKKRKEPPSIKISIGELLAQKKAIIFWGVIVLAAGSSFLFPLYPPHDSDAISYHLSTAKIFVHYHGVVLTEYLRYPVFTLLNQMLFTLMLLFSDDLSAQLVQYLFYLLIGVFIYVFCKRHLSNNAGIMGVILWYSNRLAISLNSVGFIDMGMTFFIITGVLAFLTYIKNRQINWLVLASILLGFSAAVKYTALFFVALCGLYTLWIGFRERNWRIPVIFSLVTGIVACPFYFRNIYYTGDPFFPYIKYFFKENIWSFRDFQELANEQSIYGRPKTLINFLKLPWSLLRYPQIFQTYMEPFSISYFAFLPLTFFFAILKPSLRNILVFSISYTVFWYLTPQVLRYLFPIFPLFCILSAAAFDYTITYLLAFLREKFNWQLPGWITSFVLGIIIAVISAFTLTNNFQEVSRLGNPPTNEEEKNSFLSQYLISYPAYQLLNANEKGNYYRLYSLTDSTMSYYANGVFIGDYFGPARYTIIINALGDSRKLYAELGKFQVKYFLVNNEMVKWKLPEDTYFNDHFKLIYGHGPILVYRLKSQTK